MSIIARKEFITNRWLVWVILKPTQSQILYFDHDPSEIEVQKYIDQWKEQHLYDDAPYLPVAIYDMMEVIEQAVIYIKTTASLTLTKWNTYLNSLPLEDRYAVRWFIVVMARKLNEIGEITLTDSTETQILSQMKTWFIKTPARKIRKIFYGEA